MNNKLTERNAVKIVAKTIPWLAPVPSAYFVARSSMAHLALPWPIALVVALVIEALGLTCAFMASSFADWNHTKRKTDPAAPVIVALVLGAVYLATTLSLLAGLEAWPGLARYMPIVFPFLALVGTIALALIAQQEQREVAVTADKAEQRQARQLARQERQARQPDATSSDNGATTGTLVATVTPLVRQAATMAQDGNADGVPIVPMAKRGTYTEFVSVQVARDGNGPMSASEVVAQFGVPKRTAYRWVEKFRLMNGNGHGWTAQAEVEPQAQEAAR